MLFIYDLPNWQLGLLVIVASVGASMLAYVMFRWAWRAEITDDNKGLAMAVLAVIATINSLLLAFSAVSVWESFSSADEAVSQEADTVSELARDLAIFDSPDALSARTKLRAYTVLVIGKEWATMRVGQPSLETWAAFDDMFHAIGSLDPDNPRRVALMPEIWGRANELLKHRRDRLHTSTAEVPGTLWTVVILGTILTMLTTFVLPPARFNVLMIGGLALSIGLVFYFILAMDRPFAGKESISPFAFESSLNRMAYWDETYLAR